LHRGAAAAETAEELMRSRYAAYALGETGYVFRTWHPRTRPDVVTHNPTTRWTGLRVLGTDAGGAGDATGEVTFVATYDAARGAGELRERSRFERRGGRWVYVDGDAS
jgi:SEC-C motif domain protein